MEKNHRYFYIKNKIASIYMDDNQYTEPTNEKQKVDTLDDSFLKIIDQYEQSIGFDFLFHTVKQPLYILKADSIKLEPRFELVNQSGYELLKYSPIELKEHSPIQLGFFSSITEFHDCNLLLDKDQTISYLAHIKTKGGQSISSEISLSRFKFNNQAVYLAFQRNIGNNQKVIEALRHSEFRFLQMAENIVEGIIIVEEGKRVFINSSMCQITGYPKDELRDIDEYALALESERYKIQAFKEKLTQSPQGIHGIEYWIKTKSGHEKCLRSNYTFSQRTDGRKSTYIIATDITSRKRIEQALRKSQSEFRMLAENSLDLITRYNSDLTYVYANQSIEQIMGIPISQFIGRNNHELNFDPELTSFLEDMHLEVFRTGRTLKFEFRLQSENETKVFQSHMIPELSKEGTVESVLNVARDITQIKVVEKSLKEEKQNIINENFKIGQNLKEWCNQLCQENNQESKKPEQLKPILRIAEWAQYGHNTQNYSPIPLNVNKLLQDIYHEVSERIESKKLEASLLLPVYEISIYSDPLIIRNTLDYLIENALEATETGRIEIGFDIYTDTEIVFYIKDTGKGIEPEKAEEIYHPFVSINKTNHAGLGLSIAQKNVETFGGELWFLSSPGTGSTFCFTHPAQIEKSLMQAKTASSEGKWKDLTILIVEDTDTNYLLLQSILDPFKPKLVRSINGLDAIKQVKDDPSIKLILMDIQLPDINGYEATVEIRKFNKEIPIIAQTAYAMYDDVVKALDSGCNDFIPKPLKAKKLLSVMEKYLDKLIFLT